MEDLISQFNTTYINDYQQDLFTFISSLNIDNQLKKHLLELVENDNYRNYIEIYEICLENDIILP